MSIRFFHIIFLVVTIFLFAFLSYWNYSSWVKSEEGISLLYMFVSLGSGLLIGYYGIKFYGRVRELSL